MCRVQQPVGKYQARIAIARQRHRLAIRKERRSRHLVGVKEDDLLLPFRRLLVADRGEKSGETGQLFDWPVLGPFAQEEKRGRSCQCGWLVAWDGAVKIDGPVAKIAPVGHEQTPGKLV